MSIPTIAETDGSVTYTYSEEDKVVVPYDLLKQISALSMDSRGLGDVLWFHNTTRFAEEHRWAIVKDLVGIDLSGWTLWYDPKPSSRISEWTDVWVPKRIVKIGPYNYKLFTFGDKEDPAYLEPEDKVLLVKLRAHDHAFQIADAIQDIQNEEEK